MSLFSPLSFASLGTLWEDVTAQSIHSVTCHYPLRDSLGRWVGLFVLGLLLSPLAAAADVPLQFQSADGRRTVGAVEAHAPIALDGTLDEEVWRTAKPAAEFIQAEPHEGQPATELTEVRLAFDRDAL